MNKNGELINLEIAKQIKLKRKRCHIDALGGDVLLSEVSGAQRDEIEDFNTRSEKSKTALGVGAHVVSQCWVNEDGTRVTKDWREINKLPAAAVLQMMEASLELNGMANKGIEEIAKN